MKNKVRILGVITNIEADKGTIVCEHRLGAHDIIPFQADEMKLKSISINDKVNSLGKFVNGVLELKTIEHTDNETLELNNVEIEGYLCAEPYIKHLPYGDCVAEFIVAQDNNYIPCIAWGALAFDMDAYTVGTRLSLIGKLQQRTYPVREGGEVVTYKKCVEVRALGIRPI